MTCKVPHDDEGLPEFLCRACHPELNTSPAAPRVETVEEKSAQAIRYERKVKRKLRAEVKTWRERLERMRNSRIDPRDIAKAEAILRKAEHDLYLVA